MLNRARPEVRTYGPYNGLCGSTCTLATQRPRASVARMADTISRPDVVLNNEENSGTDLIRSGPVHLSLLSFFFVLFIYICLTLLIMRCASAQAVDSRMGLSVELCFGLLDKSRMLPLLLLFVGILKHREQMNTKT